MSETALKLYDHFKVDKRYTLSDDASVKAMEQAAIKELETGGYIIIKMRTIGYVIAEICG